MNGQGDIGGGGRSGYRRRIVLRDRIRRLVPWIPAYAFLGLWCAFGLFVILWQILASFKTNRELFLNVWALPSHLQFQNYVKAWSVVKMGNYFMNSIVVVGASVLLILTISTPAAYALTRIPFRGVEFVTNFVIGGMGIPVQMLFIPLFGMLSRLHLADTRTGLILVYTSVSLPFTIFLLTAFFRSLPSELEEAAAIDGASPLVAFVRIMLPLASPGVIGAAIFNFIILWNEYMLALIFISDDSKRTISLGLYALSNSMQYTGDWVGLFAGVVIVMVPTILLFILLSERLISSITLGAVKG